MNATNWEVGSTWYTMFDSSITSSETHYNNDIPENITLLSTCRSAIGCILDTLPTHGVAIIPAFTCHSVAQPFISRSYRLHSYAVNKDLSIDWNKLDTLINSIKPDVLLIHGYFGFNTTKGHEQHLESVRQRGITIIEDRTQTMFSTYKSINAHYTVGSIRKWLPVPDGAFLSPMIIDNLIEDTPLITAKTSAMDMKRQYIINGQGTKDAFRKMFIQAEQLLDSRSRPHAMSSYTRAVLTREEINRMSNVRRDNYRILASRMTVLRDISVIFPSLDNSIVPFMLPVYIDSSKIDRNNFQQYMARHNVYPTIIWKCPDILLETIDPISLSIYDNILCFHIDQRYDISDMMKIADTVECYFKEIY